MLQHMPSLPVVVAFLVAFVASFSRIFSASKPFWARFPAWFQMLAPQLALALGAIGQGLAGGVKSWTDLTVVFVGAGALLLPGLPSNRSAAPLPSSKNPIKVPPLACLMLCLVAMCLDGCSLFGSHGSFWPVLEHCAPSPASLVSQVEDMLLAGGDYEASLKALALKDGAGIVECAVAAAVDLLTAKSGKIGASPDDAPAAARGKVFLAKVSAQ